MSSTAILEGKNAVVFGAGGSIGCAVAKEFAANGANVFLSGRTKSNVDATAREIAAIAGPAHVALVDALDDSAVDRYLDGIAKDAGRIDVVLNVTGPLARTYGNTKAAVDLTVDEFMCQRRRSSNRNSLRRDRRPAT
jgi:NAD(P)-dependent dehydrogenase (short-subunit alcohol dehydrogenase family)